MLEKIVIKLLNQFDKTSEANTNEQDTIAAFVWDLCELIALRDRRVVDDVVNELVPMLSGTCERCNLYGS